MFLLVLFLFLFIPSSFTIRMDEELVVKRWKLLRWRNVTLVVGGAASTSATSSMTRIVKEASRDSIATAVTTLYDFVEDYEQTGVGSAQNRMVFASSWNSSMADKTMEMVRTSKSDSVMVAVKRQDMERATDFWKGYAHSLSFYALSASELFRIVTLRKEGEIVVRSISEDNSLSDILDAMGVDMVVAAKLYHPYLITQCPLFGPRDCAEEERIPAGMVPDILSALSPRYNFTYSVEVFPAETDWGSPPPPDRNVSEATGLMALALRGRVDLLASLYLRSVAREAWFDYSESAHREELHCYVNADSSNGDNFWCAFKKAIPYRYT